MFISNDRLIKGNRDIEIVIGNKKYSGENIDNSGRIVVGRDIIKVIGDNEISYLLRDNILTIDF